jgi:alkaline phosphatase
MDVPLWSYGPNRPIGFFDNTELAELTADVLGINLKKVQKKLFVEVDEEYSPDEYNLDFSDPENPVLIIDDYELPISKNIIQKEGWMKELNGIVVYAPETGDVFIPKQAVRIID